MNGRPFYVFDLDGTLADSGHRRHLFGDQRAYHAACGDDLPLRPVIDLFQSLWPAARLEIWTARSEAVRPGTEVWLRRHGIDPLALTRMRPLGDDREAALLKVSFLGQSDRVPDVLFDDDPKLVAAWRAEGLVCFQVANGPEARGPTSRPRVYAPPPLYPQTMRKRRW